MSVLNGMQLLEYKITDYDLESEFRRGYYKGAYQAIEYVLQLSNDGYVRPREIFNIMAAIWEKDIYNWLNDHSQFLPPELNIKPWAEIKKEVHKMDNARCVKCGSNKRLEAHHVVKVMDGGLPTVDNVITLCFDCHRNGNEH